MKKYILTMLMLIVGIASYANIQGELQYYSYKSSETNWEWSDWKYTYGTFAILDDGSTPILVIIEWEDIKVKFPVVNWYKDRYGDLNVVTQGRKEEFTFRLHNDNDTSQLYVERENHCDAFVLSNVQVYDNSSY